MRFQYKIYRYQRPDLLNEEQYLVIKNTLKNNPNYFPFKSERFSQKFLGELRFFGIITPIIIISSFIKNDFFVFITIIGSMILFFGGIQLVPEMLSYGVILIRRKIYFNKLISKINISKDYDHLVILMN